MRYTRAETPIAVGILPASGTARVTVYDQVTDALLNLTNDMAAMSPIPPDANGNLTAWNWSLANIADPITGLAQLLIAFDHQETGLRDYCKICVRGVMDEITQTRQLVSTIV